ncbi:MAG: metal-dependent transcriptional regulator [candidate division Zixibacteria bacterium]|nr:metal-dependent transcriptional regulator [candidate division Zixibacteria bacterium]
MDVWKEFEHNTLTHSGAHYLMTIQKLIDDQGYARVSDVARHLHITPGSASIMLKSLKEKGYLKEDRNRFLRLSEDGAHLAQSVRSHRQILIAFFRDVLHINAEKAEIDACKIEHLISIETGERLLTFLQYLLADHPEAGKFLATYHAGTSDGCALHTCPVCEEVGECLTAQVGSA